MKKVFALLLALVMVFALAACGEAKTEAKTEAAAEGELAELIKAAQAEGELVVYGSCEEEYLAAATAHFEELYGIKTSYQRLSTG